MTEPATASSGNTSGSYEIDQGAGIGKAPSPWTPAGAPVSSQPRPGDADGDGLSDVFERLIGSDFTKADSDGDGLADGYEAYVSGTDPLSVDTDQDGTTDGFEIGQQSDPLRLGDDGAEVPRWTIGAGYQRHLAQMQAQTQVQSQVPAQAAPPPVVSDPALNTAPLSSTPIPDLKGGRVSATGGTPKLVASLDAAGHGNWQGAVKSGNQWFLVEAGPGDKYQIFHRLDSNGNEIDQMKVFGAAHATSFAMVGNTVYATYNGEVVTFPYQGGASTSAEDRQPTGWRGQISIDPTQRYAVIRKGNRYRAYDLATHEQIGQEVVTPKGPRQGFSIVGDSLYVLSGKTNRRGWVDSFSFTTGQQTGTQDITSTGTGHKEPEGMFGDLMGVKEARGNARRLNIYQLDTGIEPASAYMPGMPSPASAANGLASPAAAPATTLPTATAPVAPAPVTTAPVTAGPVTTAPIATDPVGSTSAATAPPSGTPTQSAGGSDLDKVKFGGETVDRRTAAMLTEAQRVANLKDPSIGDFKLSQGCFCHGVAASAGTHDGPGAFDMMTSGYSSAQKDIIGMALREVGFASWRRLPSQGPWGEHWHGIAIGTKGLPSIAAGQVKSYYAGRDGLKGNREDDQPRPETIRTWEEYQQAQGSLDQSATAPVVPTQPTTPQTGGDQFGIDGGQLLGNGAQQLNPNVDTDRDGLSDAFERLAGTDATKADTDGDGLSDSYEVFTSKTDPLLADSDLDGLTDSAELSLGSDPLGQGTDPLGQGTDPLGQGIGVGAPGAGANSPGANLGADPLGQGLGGQGLGEGSLPADPAGGVADPLAPAGQDQWEPLEPLS